MKLADSLSTPQQSLRLKELGILQESFFGWVWLGNLEPQICGNPIDGGEEWNSTFWESEFNNSAAAFTVAELSIMLGAITNGCEYDEEINQWFAHWDNTFIERFNTQAECIAEMLINYLTTTELLVNDCNSRLTYPPKQP